MNARFFAAFAAIVAAGWSSAPTGKTLVQDALSAMGGDKLKAVQTIAMKGGAGTRTRLQEQRHVSDAEDPGTLKNVVEIVDLAGGRASMNYEINEGGFKQHRHEVLTTRGGKPVGIEYVDM